MATKGFIVEGRTNKADRAEVLSVVDRLLSNSPSKFLNEAIRSNRPFASESILRGLNFGRYEVKVRVSFDPIATDPNDNRRFLIVVPEDSEVGYGERIISKLFVRREETNNC